MSLKRAWLTTACGLVLTASVVGCNQPPQSGHSATRDASAENVVVLYLGNAERQAESPEQEGEILKALADLRTLPPEQLRARRYADYGLTPGQWTLPQLLQRYYVPATPMTLDAEALYRDAQTAPARTVIDAHIKAIQEHRQVAPGP